MAEASFIRPEALLQSVGVGAGETVVHLGCGAGFYVIPAAKIVGQKGRVVGVDILPDLLSETASRAEKAQVGAWVKTIRANVESQQGSTLPGGEADWVLVANILHQSDVTKLLSEARRITKPTGKIVIVEWGSAASPLGPPVKQRVPKRQVLDIAQRLQLRLEHEFSPSQYHYGLVLCLH